MTNEFIGRKRRIGLGKESTPGTAVSAVEWIPVMTPDFKPVSTKAVDDSAYGNIDEVYSQETTKNHTEISIEGILRDDWLGYLLLGAFGSSTMCFVLELSSTTNVAVGQTITSGGGATGTIKFLEGSTCYATQDSGTFGASDSFTTSGGGSGTFTSDTAIRGHVFERLNTNSHPTFTMYKVDDVDTMRAAYCMVDTLDLNIAVGEFAKFNLTMKGKKMESTTATPSYSADNAFLAKHATLTVADDVAGIDSSPTTISASGLSLSIAKNLIDYQAFGDDDVASFHNQQFGITGDFSALFNSATVRDYMLNSTKKAMRLTLTNTDVTIGSSANPKLLLQLGRTSFQDWSDSADNNALVTQSVGFMGEFSVDDSYTGVAVLVNNNTSGY